MGATPTRPSSVHSTFEQLFVVEREPLWIILALVGLTIMGFILRVLDIDQSIAYDEAYTFIHFASRSFKHILADYSAPNNHIFHTILMGIAYRLFGGQPWALRLPAFVAGILMIPVMYIAARRFFSAPGALAAAGAIAVWPVFIDYAVNGRGYTLLIVFSLLLANFGAILAARQTLPNRIGFALTTALGFYTIPVFLYPWAGISLWVISTYIYGLESRGDKLRKVAVFINTCIIAGMLIFLLYSPVIFFGSGLDSLIQNETVQSLDWPTFLANLLPRMRNTWNVWMLGVPREVEILLLGGFFMSLIFYRKVSKQVLPLQLFMFVAAFVLIFIQRVTPVPRIWLYLEAFYLMFASAGLVWLLEGMAGALLGPAAGKKTTALVILSLFGAIFLNVLVARQQDPALPDRDRLPEEYAANYLAETLTPEDMIVATGPVDIQTAYYLSQHGIPFERFYQRDHPAKIENAIVLLRKNSRYKTLESVVDLFGLRSSLNLTAAELVFEYANVQVYSVPAR